MKKKCECEKPGEFCSGLKGAVARVKSGMIRSNVERCDLCKIFESDLDAEFALRKHLGLGPYRPLIHINPSIESILCKAREELKGFLKNEACDHNAGICYCESFQALHDLNVLLGFEAASEIKSHPWLVHLANKQHLSLTKLVGGRPVNVNNRRVA